jgi:hypothetical protein
MCDGKKRENAVLFDAYLKELQKEFDYQADGGTSYRKTTAMLALEIARQTGNTAIFFDLNKARETVSKYQNLDTERIEDIAKFLNCIIKDIHFKDNLSDEVKAYLQQKRQKQKPLSFIKKVRE